MWFKRDYVSEGTSQHRKGVRKAIYRLWITKCLNLNLIHTYDLEMTRLTLHGRWVHLQRQEMTKKEKEQVMSRI
jgi:hypothetical protein